MESLVSVIVPVYRVERYLDQCVQSIVDQTYSNLEIILVDDGSPDECPRICDKWAEKDARIKVIHQKNSGPSVARNTGLDVFQGEYVMFVDSDDYLSADAVQVLYERIKADGSDMSFGDARCVNATGAILGGIHTTVVDSLKDQNTILNELCGKNSVPCYAWGKLYQRQIYEKLRFKGKYAEDVLILFDVLCMCQTVSSVSKTIYYYRQHSASLIHTLTDDKIMDSIEVALYSAQRLLEKEKYEAARSYYTSAIHQAVNLKSIRCARKMIRAALPIVNGKLLMKYDMHTRLRYLALYWPVLHYVLRVRNSKR